MQAEQKRFEMQLQFDANQAELKRQHERELEAMRLQAKQQESAMNAQPEQMNMVAEALAMLAQAMNAPKQVIRDEQGRAVGVAPA